MVNRIIVSTRSILSSAGRTPTVRDIGVSLL